MSDDQASDLAGDLAAAFDEAAVGNSTAEVTPSEAAPAAKPEPAPADKAAAAPTDAPRDDQGRFTKRPKTWRKEALEKWDRLAQKDDPDTRDALQAFYDEDAKRTDDAINGVNQYRAAAAEYDTFQRAIAPYMATIQALGVHPVQAISGLLNMDHTLRHGTADQKAMAMQHIIQSYGLSLDGIKEPPQRMDPAMAAMQQELAGLKNYIAQADQNARMNNDAALAQHLQEFARGREHYETVRGLMADLIQGGSAPTLEAAYEMAVNSHPDLRTQAAARQRTELEQQIRAEMLKKAEDAKKAGFGVKGSGSAEIAPSSENSLLHDLNEAWAQHS